MDEQTPPPVDPALLVLNEKQRVFADEYIRTGNKKRSAMLAYDAPEASAGSHAVQTLKSDKVRAYIASRAYASAQRVEGLAADATNEAVKLAANKDILDRAGYKVPDEPPQPAQTTYNILFSAEARADVLAMEELIKARLTAPPLTPDQHAQETDTPDSAF